MNNSTEHYSLTELAQVHEHKPVRNYQAAPAFVVANMEWLKKYKDANPSQLADAFYEQLVVFTQPLQRRAETTPTGSRFWWEPSGGNNDKAFTGIVTGVRMYSCGTILAEEGGYESEQQFPVLLITYSPFRNPIPVVPWLCFPNTRTYLYWYRQARQNRNYVELLRFAKDNSLQGFQES